MVLKRIGQLCGFCWIMAALSVGAPARAQESGPPPVVQKIEATNTRIEMTVDSSRILSLDKPIPRAQVMNPELLDFTVISENQVQIHAKKAGMTTVNFWDEDKTTHSVDVLITGDVRELERLLRLQFPSVSLKLVPTKSSSLIISGYVDRPDYVNRIVRIAEDYYPKIFNNMIVGGSQQVLLHVKVMEVSRTNLKVLGFDFAGFTQSGDFLASSAAGLITKASATSSIFRNASLMTTSGRETLQFGIVNDPSGFVGFLEALKQEDLLKVLAEPNLVTVSGRPASYLVGGQMPYPMPTGFGNIAIAFRDFGTQIDFVPVVLGNGGVRLEVRPKVSEIDPTLSITINGTSVPGFRVREVDTGVELKFGQTLAIAGLLQQTSTIQKKGLPYLMDIPYIGAAFSRKSNQINEVELLILVRPELVEAMDCEQVPPCGPGETSLSPDDCGLFFKGYMEVPIPAGIMGPGPGAMGSPEGVQAPPAAPPVEQMPTGRAR
ncbi:MAG TPA: pilus assembly protein N-terminal domain-containing protein, partial [Pirellulales bacterium]|nr:pilus assembly protein N-terminal domain-containing protein [Pirellulales bacterium]